MPASLLVAATARPDVRLRRVDERRGSLGIGARQHREARLLLCELLEGQGRRLAVELPGGAVVLDVRIEPIQRPVAGCDRFLLVAHAARHVDAVGDAGRVRDDQRRATVRLGLGEHLDRVRHVGAHRDLRDVDVAVARCEQTEVLLALPLPPAANFATAPRGVAFEACPPVFE